MAQYYRFYIYLCGGIVYCNPAPPLYQQYVPAYSSFRVDHSNKQRRAGFRGPGTVRQFRFYRNSGKAAAFSCNDRRTPGIIYHSYSFHAVILEKIKKNEKNFYLLSPHEKTKKNIDKIPEYKEEAIKMRLKRTFFAVHYISQRGLFPEESKG